MAVDRGISRGEGRKVKGEPKAELAQGRWGPSVCELQCFGLGLLYFKLGTFEK